MLCILTVIPQELVECGGGVLGGSFCPCKPVRFADESTRYISSERGVVFDVHHLCGFKGFRQRHTFFFGSPAYDGVILLNGGVVTFHEFTQAGASFFKAHVLRIVLLVHHCLFVYSGVQGEHDFCGYGSVSD